MQDKFIQKIENKFKVSDRAADKIQIKAKKVHSGYLIYEYSPKWNNKNEWINFDVAKIIFRSNPERCLVYWKRASGKWELYKESSSFASALNVIDKDEHHCFWG